MIGTTTIEVQITENDLFRGNATLTVEIYRHVGNPAVSIVKVEGTAYVRAVDEGEDDNLIDKDCLDLYDVDQLVRDAVNSALGEIEGNELEALTGRYIRYAA